MGEEEKRAVLDVLDSGIIAQGPKVSLFEKNFSSYCNTNYGIALNSGTAALHLAVLSLGIGPGDEVITSPFSFVASANSILYAGAKPVFVDVEEDYFTIDVNKIQDKITKNTKAIIPVHLYGHPADMIELQKIAKDNNLFIIEDAAQAHGAEINEKKVGGFGNLSAFSFYPTKNITTSEGGMITTDNESLSAKCKILRDQGAKEKYHHDELGFNFRMTDIAAAIGLEQLKKLDNFNSIRIKNANKLSSLLKNSDITTPKVKKGYKHVFHQYTIKVKNRDSVIQKLLKSNIGHAIHYPIPIHQQQLYKKLGYKESFPISERLSKEVLSLPIHPLVKDEDLEIISEALK